jgi:crotonobetainyl-CoA:carnitine CoA-transferase CaiB-like acyl-CoA transferase
LGALVALVYMRRLPEAVAQGKWNTELDLRQEEGRAKLRALVLDADVVLDGYRPGVMAKHGFGKDDILRMIAESDRGRGIVYARENTYGWQGPWAHRSGWQQISDANTGVSYAFGRVRASPWTIKVVLFTCRRPGHGQR